MTATASWSAGSGRTASRIVFERGDFVADLDAELGGQHPSPHDLLDAALAACTALTLELYAKRKAMPLERVDVKVTHEKTASGQTMKRELVLVGDALSDADRENLLRIANMCPVHRTLTGTIAIATAIAG
jgi:putative redox protein